MIYKGVVNGRSFLPLSSHVRQIGHYVMICSHAVILAPLSCYYSRYNRLFFVLLMNAIAIVRDYRQLYIYRENMFRFWEDSIEHRKICFSSSLWKL